MAGSDVVKALEVWTLQSLLNLSILLGVFVLGLILVQPYLRSLRQLLTLRVSVEIWDVVTRVVSDLLLAVVVAMGLLVLNPDIMADIKIAIPFVPVATILFALALVIRLLRGGHVVGSPAFVRSVWLLFAANVINVVGFSLVMEAPSGEYLAVHPSAFWTFVKTQLRSNANLELTQTVFFICFPVLMLVLLWGFWLAMKQMGDAGKAK